MNCSEWINEVRARPKELPMKPKWMERIVRHATEHTVSDDTGIRQYERMLERYRLRLPHNNRNVSVDLAVAMLQEIKRLRRKVRNGNH
jgi:hypothetical protein